MVDHKNIIEFVKWAELEVQPHYNTSDDSIFIPLNNIAAYEFVGKIVYMNYQFCHPFNYNWSFDKNDESANLSSGENAILNLLSRLYSLKDRLIGRTPIFLFVDEGDLGHHPKWQKEFISLLINNLVGVLWYESYRMPMVQIILTSHSPFVLSDLPKENIIFLRKDPQTGHCQVADGLNDMKQTFGANIHTLLSDSFFMDGLMGDFAKGKIDEVIRHLNNEPKKEDDMNDEKAGKIINMIGEPILKRHLEKQFQYKKQNAEIKELRERIEKLEKQNNPEV